MDFEVKKKLSDIEKIVKDNFPNTLCYFRENQCFMKLYRLAYVETEG